MGRSSIRTSDTGPNTGVCYAKISHKAGPVTVYTTHNVDIESFRGAYWGDAGVSKEQTWGRWKLEGSLSGGWASSKFNEAYWGSRTSAFNLVAAQSSLTISLPGHVYLRPHFEFSSIVDRQLRAPLSSPTLLGMGGCAVGRQLRSAVPAKPESQLPSFATERAAMTNRLADSHPAPTVSVALSAGYDTSRRSRRICSNLMRSSGELSSSFMNASEGNVRNMQSVRVRTVAMRGAS